MDTLIIRADASPAIGHGHVMRCLALAQAWQDRGGRCIFVSAQPAPALETRLKSEGFGVVYLNAIAGSREDASQLADTAAQNAARYAVIDGYHFGREYQQILKCAGLKLLVIDDYGQIGAYAADIILDQNAGAREILYAHREPATELLLGTRYAMLRREFKAWSEWKREIPPVARKILVTMGGSDPENLTLRVVEALRKLDLPEVEAVVVIGGGNAHASKIRILVEKSQNKLRVESNVRKMPELMAQADLAVASAGSTSWEICLLGLPAIVIDAAPNQVPLAQALNAAEAAVYIPRIKLTMDGLAETIRSLATSRDLRQKLSTNASKFVDGRGAARVVSAMFLPTIALRNANPDDCRLLWEWATDSTVRSASFSPGPIEWDEHRAWFQNKIEDPRCLILIAEDEQRRPLGQVRADFSAHQDAEIDISVSRDHRGMGFGPHLISQCVREVFNRTKAERVHAFIRPENSASLRAFQKACFTSLGLDFVRGHQAFHYVCNRACSQGRS